jgi:hypothetical protein
MTYANAFLTTGAILAIVAAWRLYAGRACIFQSATPDPDKPDRPSILVSSGILIFGALVFIAGGIHALVR